MNLIHFSAQPIIELKNIEQSDQLSFCEKPRGLWVSDESSDYGWKSWCHAEEFRLSHLEYAYQIVLHEENEILIINSEFQLNKFIKEYGREGREEIIAINWKLLTNKYKGIIITPYISQKDIFISQAYLNYMWYSLWSCASGCIWDVSAIKSITLKED